MTEEEKKEVSWRIGEEGIDYTFRNYSNFGEIQGVRFHELRETYIKAAQELEAYVGYPEADEHGDEES